MRYLLTLTYFGKNFYGYQIQKNKRTVQGELEKALETIFKTSIKTYSSGRTDSGVHAIGQVAHFDTEKEIDTAKLKKSINGLLASDLKIVNIEKNTNIHARFDAKQKTYVYRFYVSDFISPFHDDFAHRVLKRPDLEMMKTGAKIIIGKHDFANYRALHSSANTTVRTIFNCFISYKNNSNNIYYPMNTNFTKNSIDKTVSPKNDTVESNICSDKNALRDINTLNFTKDNVNNLNKFSNYGFDFCDSFEIYITGDGFLYKMVRNIAGALLKLGQGEITLKQLKDSFKTNTLPNNITLPAKGLFLLKVDY